MEKEISLKHDSNNGDLELDKLVLVDARSRIKKLESEVALSRMLIDQSEKEKHDMIAVIKNLHDKFIINRLDSLMSQLDSNVSLLNKIIETTKCANYEYNLSSLSSDDDGNIFDEENRVINSANKESDGPTLVTKGAIRGIPDPIQKLDESQISDDDDPIIINDDIKYGEVLTVSLSDNEDFDGSDFQRVSRPAFQLSDCSSLTMKCKKNNESPDAVLAQAQQMLNLLKNLTEECRTAKLRNQELEATLKKTRQDRDNLRNIVGNIQNIFKNCNDYNIESANSITGELPQSSSAKMNSANSWTTEGEVKATPSLSTDGEAQREIFAVLKNNESIKVETGVQTDNTVTDAGVVEKNSREVSAVVEDGNNEAVRSRVEISVRTDHDTTADSPKEKNQLVKETTSSAICNIESAPDTNGIKNYFSSFYVDPQTDIYDENTVLSFSSPSQQVGFSSRESLDKRCVTVYFDADGNYTTPNFALVQQHRETNQPSLENENVHFTYSANDGSIITTVHNEYEDNQEINYYDNDLNYEMPVQCEYKPAAVKRTHVPPTNQSKAKKTKPNFEWVSDDDSDSYYILSGRSSTSDESNYKLAKKKKTFKVKCKVCEISHKTQYFSAYRALDLHLLKKHPLNTFPTYLRCPYGEKCTRHYLLKSSLLKHVNSNHPGANSTSMMKNCETRIKSRQCAYCAGTFLSCRLFKQHMAEFHPGCVETEKVIRTPELLGHIADVKAHSKIETSKKSVRKTGKMLIKRKEGKFYISESRELSVSSVDDDYDPDAISISGKADQSIVKKRGHPITMKGSSLKSGRSNTIVVKAEIHETKTVITQNEAPPSQPEETEKNQNNSDSIDINDFVLNSINEISSMIDEQNTTTAGFPSVTTKSSSSITTNQKTRSEIQFQSNLSTCQYQSSFMAPSSLPCLLDNCTGCDCHPEPAIMSLTLDDEYVSSCRDEILADLYSIPDNPPMVTGFFTGAFSSQPEVPEDAGKTVFSIENRPNKTTSADTVCGTEASEIINMANVRSPNSAANNYNTANSVIDNRQPTINPDDIFAENDNRMQSVSCDVTCANKNKINSNQTSVPANTSQKIIPIKKQSNKTATVDVNMVVNEEPIDTEEPVYSETISVENENREKSALNAEQSITNDEVVNKTVPPEAPAHEFENQFMKVDINDEISSGEDASNLKDTAFANDDVEVDKIKSLETCVTGNQNKVAEVVDQNHENDRACDVPSSLVDKEPSAMEVDNPKFEEPCSSQTSSTVARLIFSSNKDRLEINDTKLTNTVSSATKTAHHQTSIFDAEDDCDPATSNQTELPRNFDSSADNVNSKTEVNVSDGSIIEKCRRSNRVDSPTICEITTANEVAHRESIESATVDDTVDENKPSETSSSTKAVCANVDEISLSQNPPEGAKSTTSNEISEHIADISSTNVENCDSANLDDTCNVESSLNLSAYKVNTTFYDEFDVVHACEVETCHENDSTTNTPCSVSAQVSPLLRENRCVIDPVILKHLLSRRTTNEIIEEVQIEIEIGDFASSPSSAHKSESFNTQSSPHVEIDEGLRRNDDFTANVCEKKIKSSFISEKLAYPVYNKTPDFTSLVKRMLTENNLGIVEKTKSRVSSPALSSCSTSESECSKSSCSCSHTNSNCSCENCSIDVGKDNDVSAVESGSPHLSPMEGDAIREKTGYEVDVIIERKAKSPPILSPLPPSPAHITPDQSHNSIEANAARSENQEDDSSPLITSSNQRIESDLVFDFGTPTYNIGCKSEAELISIFKLNTFTVMLERLPINFRTPSGPYELRRKRRYACLNSLTSHSRK